MMLVLTRKRGEEIRIGDSMTVIVLECTGKRVKLGIVGPRQIPVVRGEMTDRLEPSDADPNRLCCLESTPEGNFITAQSLTAVRADGNAVRMV